MLTKKHFHIVVPMKAESNIANLWFLIMICVAVMPNDQIPHKIKIKSCSPLIKNTQKLMHHDPHIFVGKSICLGAYDNDAFVSVYLYFLANDNIQPQ